MAKVLLQVPYLTDFSLLDCWSVEKRSGSLSCGRSLMTALDRDTACRLVMRYIQHPEGTAAQRGDSRGRR